MRKYSFSRFVYMILNGSSFDNGKMHVFANVMANKAIQSLHKVYNDLLLHNILKPFINLFL